MIIFKCYVKRMTHLIITVPSQSSKSQLIMKQLLRRNEMLVKGGRDGETDGDGYCD